MDNGTIRVVCPADQAVAAKIREQLEEVEMFLLCAKSGAKTGNVRMRRDYVKRALDLILALPVSLQLYFGRRSFTPRTITRITLCLMLFWLRLCQPLITKSLTRQYHKLRE